MQKNNGGRKSQLPAAATIALFGALMWWSCNVICAPFPRDADRILRPGEQKKWAPEGAHRYQSEKGIDQKS